MSVAIVPMANASTANPDIEVNSMKKDRRMLFMSDCAIAPV